MTLKKFGLFVLLAVSLKITQPSGQTISLLNLLCPPKFRKSPPLRTASISGNSIIIIFDKCLALVNSWGNHRCICSCRRFLRHFGNTPQFYRHAKSPLLQAQIHSPHQTIFSFSSLLCLNSCKNYSINSMLKIALKVIFWT